MADGKVVIDTHLNNAGLKKGVNQISGSLGGLKSVVGKLGVILGAAFSVSQLVKFGAACVQLGSDVAEVQNVVDTAFGGMSYKMEKFADTAITQFGMSQLAAKKTGSTYMAMARGMGVAEDAASDMAIALTGLSGDVASFFNLDQETAAYKLRSIFTGETEALKDLGVVMTQTNLQSYAMAHGMNSNIQAMSQAERVALQYSFVVDQLRLASGDFAKTQDSWANQTRILAMQWQQFMSVIGQALTTILLPLVKILNTIVAALINVANGFNTVVQAIFGGTKKQIKQSTDAAGGLASANSGIGGSAMDAAKQENKLANSTKKAGKAAKGALAAFDQLNVLQQDAGSGEGGGTSSDVGNIGGVSAGSMPIEVEPEIEDTLSPQIQAIVDKIHALVEPLKAINFDPLVAAFDKLKEAAAPLVHSLFSGLEWAYYNIFVPLAAWTIEDLLPVFLEVLAGALNVLNAVIEALKPLAGWLWDNFLKPIASWTGGLIIKALQLLAEGLDRIADWVKNNKGQFEAIIITIGLFMALWKATDIATWLINAGGVVGVVTRIKDAVKAATKAKLADKIMDLQIIALYTKDFVVGAAKALASIVKNTAAWVASTAAKVANTAAQWLQIAATTAWNVICTVATAVTTAFGAAVAFLTSPIGLVILAIGALIAIVVLLVQHWDTVKAAAIDVWNKIVDAWHAAGEWFKTTVVEPIVGFFRNLWDNVLTFARTAWNSLSNIWNIVPGWFKDIIIAPIVNYFSTMFKMIKGVFSGIVEFISGVFSGDWRKAWNGIKKIFGSIWDGITGLLKNSINGIIGFINGMLSAITNGLNFVIEKINTLSIDVPDWVPVVGGESFGLNIPTISAPQIPKLAQGAVLPANKPFLAMVGDQKNGTNVEAPLATIQQALMEALAQSGGQDITIRFAASGGLEQLVRLLKPYIDKEDNRRGARLITGGVY